MPNCSIKQCSAHGAQNQPRLTMHRFPRGEYMRKKWLDAIGLENINPRHKNWHICSLHFEDKWFNRTLDVIRLREGAVPSLFVKKFQDPIDRLNISVLQENIDTPRSINSTQLKEKETPVSELESQMEKLKRTCEKQKKTIKNLNEKVRRRDKKLANLSEIVGVAKKEIYQ